MFVASGQHLRNEGLDRDRAVAGHGPSGKCSVTEHVVTQLDQLRAWQCPVHQLGEVGFGPAVEQVDADAQSRHLRERDGVAQRVGDVDVGVQTRRVLDRQCDAGLLRPLRTQGATAAQNCSAACSQVSAPRPPVNM